MSVNVYGKVVDLVGTSIPGLLMKFESRPVRPGRAGSDLIARPAIMVRAGANGEVSFNIPSGSYTLSYQIGTTLYQVPVRVSTGLESQPLGSLPDYSTTPSITTREEVEAVIAGELEDLIQVKEAPVDGRTYGRLNSEWTPLEIWTEARWDARFGEKYALAFEPTWNLLFSQSSLTAAHLEQVNAQINFPMAPVGEAPTDGGSYVRKLADWEPLVIPEFPEIPVLEAPADGKQYVRQDADWAEVDIPDQVDEEALKSVVLEEVQDNLGDWVAALNPEAVGIGEAPLDTQKYGRFNRQWTPINEWTNGKFDARDLSTHHLSQLQNWLSSGSYMRTSDFDTRTLKTVHLGQVWDLIEDALADFETDLGAITEAPADGKIYGRTDGDWSEINQWSDAKFDARPLSSVHKTYVDTWIGQWWAANEVGVPVGEAPTDGGYYARRNSNWFSVNNWSSAQLDARNLSTHQQGQVNTLIDAKIIAAGAIEEAPNNTNLYARSGEDWVSFLPWTSQRWADTNLVTRHLNQVDTRVLSTGLSLPFLGDAPSDGKMYGRFNGTWTEFNADTAFLLEAPLDGESYVRRDGVWIALDPPLIGEDSDNPNAAPMNSFRQFMQNMAGRAGKFSPPKASQFPLSYQHSGYTSYSVRDTVKGLEVISRMGNALSSEAVFFRGKSVPVGETWEAVMGVRVNSLGRAHYIRYGLTLHDPVSGESWILSYNTQNGSPGVIVHKVQNWSVYRNANQTLMSNVFGGEQTWFFRVQKTGAGYILGVSFDEGTTWDDLAVQTPAAGVNFSQIGIGINHFNTTYPAYCEVVYYTDQDIGEKSQIFPSFIPSNIPSFTPEMAGYELRVAANGEGMVWANPREIHPLTPEPYGKHKTWRVRVMSNSNALYNVLLAEVYLREVPGGASVSLTSGAAVYYANSSQTGAGTYGGVANPVMYDGVESYSVTGISNGESLVFVFDVERSIVELDLVQSMRPELKNKSIFQFQVEYKDESDPAAPVWRVAYVSPLFPQATTPGNLVLRATSPHWASAPVNLMPRLHEYLIGDLPSPAPMGQTGIVADHLDGPTPAFSDGTNWRSMIDRSIIA